MFDGKKIMEMRIAKGKSRTDILKATGISSRTLQNWEYGVTKDINMAADVNNIAHYLGCSLQDLCKDGVVIANNEFNQDEKRYLRELLRGNDELAQGIIRKLEL